MRTLWDRAQSVNLFTSLAATGSLFTRDNKEAQVWQRILCAHFNKPADGWKLMLKNLNILKSIAKATAVKNFNESSTTTCAEADKSGILWSWWFSWTESRTTQWWKKWWCNLTALHKWSQQETRASSLLPRPPTSWDKLTARWVVTCTTWSSPKLLKKSTVCWSALMFATLDHNQLLDSQLRPTVRCLNITMTTLFNAKDKK